MSDTGRQSMTDKAAASMKPNSQKGMVEQAGDMMSSAMDSGAAALQPNKSGSQRVSDSMTGKGTGTGSSEDSLLNKAKNSIGMGNNNSGSNSNN